MIKSGTMQIKRVVFAILLGMFVFNDIIKHIIPQITYLDEVIAMLSIPFFFSDIKKQWILKVKKDSYTQYIIILCIVGFVGNIIYQYQRPIAVIQDFILVIKFWLSIYVGKILFTKFDLHKNGLFVYRIIRLLVYLLAGLTILGELFIDTFVSEYRYGLKSIKLFYDHPSSLAAMCMLLICLLLSVYPRTRKGKAECILLLIVMATTLRTKAIGTILSFILIYYIVIVRKKKINIWTIMMFIPALVFIGWDNISFYFLGSLKGQSARLALLVTSIKIMKQNFPIGTGFATFGSYMSGVYYSPVYRIYGIYNTFGLVEGSAGFINDSFWPMIMGQFGIVGLFMMLLGILMLFLKIQKIRKIDKYYYISALGLIVYLLISSTAEAAFVHPVSIPMALLLGGMLRNDETVRMRGGVV